MSTTCVPNLEPPSPEDCLAVTCNDGLSSPVWLCIAVQAQSPFISYVSMQANTAGASWAVAKYLHLAELRCM